MLLILWILPSSIADVVDACALHMMKPISLHQLFESLEGHDHQNDQSVFADEVLAALPGLKADYISRVPFSTPETREGAQDILNRLEVGKVLEARPAIISGDILSELVVVTHQKEVWQLATADLLQSPRFIQMPRVLLVGRAYGAVDPDFARSATLAVMSEGGKLRYPTTAKNIYLMGGYAAYCLSETVENLIRNAQAHGLSEIKLHFVSDLIYRDGDWLDNLKAEILRELFLIGYTKQVRDFGSGTVRVTLSGTHSIVVHMDFIDSAALR